MNIDALNSSTGSPEDNQSAGLSILLISLLKGVLYQDSDPAKWSQLLNLQSRVRDYVAILGLELILDEAEGYAFLRSRPDLNSGGEGESTIPDHPVPRLIVRRPLSFSVSLLLALLRKKLAEFDASGDDTRLVLSREDLLELILVFLPESSNEAKLQDQLNRDMNKVIELGFLRVLRQNTSGQPQQYEVRRILKAYVDAQWLADFDNKLAEYKEHRQGTTHDPSE